MLTNLEHANLAVQFSCSIKLLCSLCDTCTVPVCQRLCTYMHVYTLFLTYSVVFCVKPRRYGRICVFYTQIAVFTPIPSVFRCILYICCSKYPKNTKMQRALKVTDVPPRILRFRQFFCSEASRDPFGARPRLYIRM